MPERIACEILILISASVSAEIADIHWASFVDFVY
jgi:hypothetical protein